MTLWKPSGSVSPSVEINKIRDFSSISNCCLTCFKRSSVQIWYTAPRVTAPDSPDITDGSPEQIAKIDEFMRQ